MAIIPIPMLAGELARLEWYDSVLVVVLSALIVHFAFNRYEPTRLRTVSSLLLLVPFILSVLFVHHTDSDGDVDFDEDFYPSLPSAIFTSFAIFHATLTLSIVAYRLSPFHPLARHPGPLLAKVSKLYMAYIVLRHRPTQWLWFQQQHEKYGDAVRIGPNEVCLRDVDTLQPMLGSTGLPRGPSWPGRSSHPPVPSLLSHRDMAAHAKRRRPWTRAFMPAAVQEYEPMLRRRATQLVEDLRKQEGVVDLDEWISLFSYDFMGDMVFGGGTELLRDGDSKGTLARQRTAFRTWATLVYDQMPWLSYYTKKFPSLSKETNAFRDMAMGRTEERCTQGSTTKDLFYYLNNEDGAEKEDPPLPVVLSDGGLAIVAGSGTTASTISTVFFSLLRNHEMYKRLQDEVDKYYPPGEDALNAKWHVEMPYLEAVINETLRMYPVLPGGSQRHAEKGKGGKVLGPYFIPEGNNVRLHTYSVQRDPRYFSDPETFWPDRWLIAQGLQSPPSSGTSTEKGDKEKGEFRHEPRAFHPFSFGPANCVGKQLAMKNMRTVLCYVIQKLEVSLPEGMGVQDLEKQFVYRTGNLKVVVKRRD